MAERYNGWANRDTWLVALWLNNDYGNYQNWWSKRKSLAKLPKAQLVAYLRNLHYGDKIVWKNVNITEIKEMLKED